MNPQDNDRRSLMMHRIIAARLRAQPKTDRVAVTHGSRGLQPTGSGAGRSCRVATWQSRSQSGSGEVFAVSLRDTEVLDNRIRGLKPTADMRHHYVVEQMRPRRVDILSTCILPAGRTECPPSLKPSAFTLLPGC